MAEQELEMEEGGGKKKLIIIIVAVVVLLAGGAAAYFMMGSSDAPAAEDEVVAEEAAPAEGSESSARVGSALYVAMPRAFTFNVPGQDRDRMAQIKVQLMVRGFENEDLASNNIPMIEGTLLKVFYSSNADDLATEAGKIELRNNATREVQAVLKKEFGKPVVEQVLLTGFVMQ